MIIPPLSFSRVRVAVALTCLISVVLLAGCGHRRQQAQYQPPRYGESQPLYSPFPRWGEVAAIDRIRFGRSPTGAPNVVGGVAGVYIGGTPESDRYVSAGAEAFRVTVRMDDGNIRAFDYERLGDVRIGSRVRIEGGRIFLD